MTAESISAQNVDLKGLINNENLTEILNDAVTRDSTREISGTKTFRNITIHFLESKKNLEEPVEDSKVIRLTDIDVLDSVSVRNIYFNEQLNDMDKDEFEDILDEEVLELVMNRDRKLGNLTVFGRVFVESQRIGHVSLEDFENNTVKRDEPLEFGIVEFRKYNFQIIH